MNRSAVVLILASIVTIAALASASLGLSYVQAMMETAGSSRMGGHQMNHSNSTLCDSNMSSRMNMTPHMSGSTYSGHADIHNQLNMTEHMQDMHGGNVTPASHMENIYGGCHD